MALTVKRKIYSGPIIEQLVYNIPDGTPNIEAYDPDKQLRKRFRDEAERAAFLKEISRRVHFRNFMANFSPTSLYSTLTFEAPDMEKFPLLSYAFEAIAAGGNVPCVLNAANEIAVAAFLQERLRFTDMPRLVLATLEAIPYTSAPDYETLVHTNDIAREKATELLRGFNN